MGFSNKRYKDLWVRSRLRDGITEAEKQSQVMTICKWLYLWLCSNYTLYIITPRVRFDFQNTLSQSLAYEIKSNHELITEIWSLCPSYGHIILHGYDCTVSSQFWPHFCNDYKCCVYWKLRTINSYWLYSKYPFYHITRSSVSDNFLLLFVVIKNIMKKFFLYKGLWSRCLLRSFSMKQNYGVRGCEC